MKKIYLLFVFLSIAAVSYSQCMMVPVSLSERINTSGHIIEGKVISQASFWNYNSTLIYTENVIDVYKVFKGNVIANKISIVTEGGTVGNNKHVIEPSLELKTGNIATFFLAASSVQNVPSNFNSSLVFEPYASAQGAINYDVKSKTGNDVFNTYINIDVEVYQTIVTQLGQSYFIVQPFNILNVGNPGNSPLMAPGITGIAPASLPAGRLNNGPLTTITITGTGFTSYTGPANLEFPDANNGGAGYISCPAGHIVSWTATQIVAWIPTGAGSGNIRVTDNAGATQVSPIPITITYNESNVNSGLNYYSPDLVNDNGLSGYTYVYNTTFNGNAPAVAAFERALSTWRCGTYVNFNRLSPMVATGIACQASDGTNLVTFDGSCALPAGVLGISYSYYGSCGAGIWYLTENDLKFRTNGTGFITWNWGSGATTGSNYDFESVCLHELGHSHQLGHTILAPPSVMHWALPNATDRRTLVAASEVAGGNDILSRSVVNNACGPTGMVLLNASNCNISAPTAEFSGTPLTGCNSMNVTFTDLSVGNPANWNWTFTGGVPNSFNGQNPPVINYPAPGTYTVSLTVSNAWGTDTETKTNYITVNNCPPPVAGFTGNPTTVCENGSVLFSDASSGNPTTWNWTFTGGTPNSFIGQNPPAISYSTAGTYTVSLFVSNANGSNTNTKNNYITVNVCPPPPVADFSAVPTTVCINTNVQFTNLTTGAYSNLQWTFPGGTPPASVALNPVVTYASPGIYSATLIATGVGGSSTMTKNNYITVNACAAPTANFAAGPTQICVGQQVNFADLSTGGPNTWNWTFTGGTPNSFIGQNPPAITYSAAGTYTVSLFVSNAFGNNTMTQNNLIQVAVCPPVGSGLIVNDGGYIHVQAAALLYDEGGAINQDNVGTGTWQNHGIIELKGDWTNNSGSNAFTNVAPQGNFIMSGAGQLITGSTPTYFDNLTLSGTGVKSQTVDARVTAVLELNDRELATDKNIMHVTNPAVNAVLRTGQPNQSTANGFVSSNTTGRLWRNTNSTSAYLFPVGSILPTKRYRPVALTPTSAAPQTFGSRFVNNDPTPDGYDRALRDPNINAVLPGWYQKINQVSGTSPVTITLYYDFVADNIISYANLLMTEWGFGVPYIWKDMGIVSFIAAASPNLASTTKNSWNTFTTENFSLAVMSSPLPVELLNFTFDCVKQNEIALHWITASEINNAYFTLEKSNDGLTFSELTKIKGAGSSSSQNEYSFTDKNASGNIIYYRLTQTDYNGRISSLGTIAAGCKKDNWSNGSVLIYPNPVSDNLSVDFNLQNEESVRLSLTDMAGRLILSRDYSFETGLHKIALNLSNLSAGAYQVSFTSNSGQVVKKVFKGK
ncbi:MAG TPA: PKD domain-containing protein [Bacteroidia bacterium]|nr:PKD domain-containing protein [Bacteroidia bacterium]